MPIITYNGVTFSAPSSVPTNTADLLLLAQQNGFGNAVDPIYQYLLSVATPVGGSYTPPTNIPIGGPVSNNTPSSGGNTLPPTDLNIRGYRDIMWAIQFWKQSIVLEFREVEFKFKNTGLGNNGAAKLTISGITPKLEDAGTGRGTIVDSKEYVIYTELRGINLERWSVRVPWIFDTSADYNVLDGNSNIPYYYKLVGGLGYTNLNEYSPSTFIPTGLLPIFENVTSTGTNRSIKFEFDGVTSRINSSTLLKSSISDLLGTYGEHPMLVFYNSNTNANNTNKKFYNVLPIGIDKYKVNLTLANGEAVTRFFDTKWNPISA